jgi:hypothetical protein
MVLIYHKNPGMQPGREILLRKRIDTFMAICYYVNKLV